MHFFKFNFFYHIQIEINKQSIVWQPNYAKQQPKKKEQKKIHLTKAGIFQTISDVLSISYLWENLHSRNICRLLTLNRFDCLRSQNKYILFQN